MVVDTSKLQSLGWHPPVKTFDGLRHMLSAESGEGLSEKSHPCASRKEVGPSNPRLRRRFRRQLSAAPNHCIVLLLDRWPTKDLLMKSSIVKRSIVIDGHKTSVSLEDAFWSGLKEIAHAQCVTLSKMVAEIDETRQHSNLSSAIRLFVLDRMRAPLRTPEAGERI